MTDQTNAPIVDRRAKPNWMVVWTGRIAPALAGVLAERLFTNDMVNGIALSVGLPDKDVRSFVLFAFIVALTSPMTYVNILCVVIEAVRGFISAASMKISNSCNKPIEGNTNDDI